MPKAQQKERSGFWVLSDVALGLVAAGALGGAAYCTYALTQMAGFFGDLAWATYAGLGTLATFGAQACSKIREIGLHIQQHKDSHPDVIARGTGAPARTAAAAASLCLVATWNLATHVRDTLDEQEPKDQPVSTSPARTFNVSQIQPSELCAARITGSLAVKRHDTPHSIRQLSTLG